MNYEILIVIFVGLFVISIAVYHIFIKYEKHDAERKVYNDIEDAKRRLFFLENNNKLMVTSSWGKVALSLFTDRYTHVQVCPPSLKIWINIDSEFGDLYHLNLNKEQAERLIKEIKEAIK